MRKIFLSVLAVSLMFSSCSNFVDGYELSPNDPLASDATPNLLLTVAEVSAFSSYTGQLARTAAILTQQQAGVQAQYEAIAAYTILPGDNVNEWESIYSNGLTNSQTLIDLAGDENPYYRGIARVLKAMHLGIATDFWGDIPNSQALQGVGNFTPAYDAQEAVIADIQALLDGAITDFGAAATDNIELPGSDDLIFGGDMTAWNLSAHILKARYHNRLSERDPTGSATAALAALDAAFGAGLSGPEDDMNAVFGDAGNELNQWYAFEQERGGYMTMGAFFVDTLLGLDDPRLAVYADTTTAGIYEGTPLGSLNPDVSVVGPYFSSPTAPMPLITYVEAKFIEAEAALRSGNAGRAATAYNDAVQTHIEQITGSAPSAAYIAANADEDASSISLEKIMFQKYIAMFTQPEVWADWRRTGQPSLSPDPRSTQGQIPLRFPTPQSEIDYNSNAPEIMNIFMPVWWDN